MDRGTWAIVCALIACLAGCSYIDDADLFGPVVVHHVVTGASSSSSSSSSSISGTGGTSSSSSSSGEGGAGGTPCVPSSAACGAATCGEVDDGCGSTVVCGARCSVNQVCADGACCAPKTACDVHHCGTEPDGCGGEIACDTTCGGNPWLHCDPTGTCACSDAHKWQNPNKADLACAGGVDTLTPWYCGDIDKDAHVPVGCQLNVAGGSFVPAPDGTLLWCCPPLSP